MLQRGAENDQENDAADMFPISQQLWKSPAFFLGRFKTSGRARLNVFTRSYCSQGQKSGKVNQRSWALNGAQPHPVSHTPRSSPGLPHQRARPLSSSPPETGVFDKPELSSPDGLAEATKSALARAAELVNIITAYADTPSIAVIERFDELSDVLCQVADLAECIRQVHPDPSVVERAQSTCMVVGNYVEQLNTSVELHRALQNVLDSNEFYSFDEVTQRTAESFMHDFKISGIHLEESMREEVVELNNQILELSHKFVQNACQPILINREGCPPFITESFPSNSEYVMIDHVPSLACNAKVRAIGYLTYHGGLPHQQEVLESLLSLRDRLARLVGYPTYAHRVLESTMAETPERVARFLDSLSEKVLPLAKEDVGRMQDLKRKFGDPTDTHSINPWDTAYVSSLAQRQFFSHDLQGIESWFSLDACLSGLDLLFQSLFGVRMEVVPTKNGETWDPLVNKIAFIDESEGLLGYVYCDLFSRLGKIASNCHFTIQGGRELADGRYQTPIITLCCGFQPPAGTNAPALLPYHAVENLFHEMGHALHSMLGRPKYQNVTGTRCSTDFAEVPSILMEYFLGDSRVLATFAKHYQSKEPLPSPVLKTLHLSQNVFPAYETQNQVLLAVMDQRFHGHHPLGKSTTDLYADLHGQYSAFRHIPNTASFLRFSHLYGYAAKYYSYLWARAGACLIWKTCFEADPFSREVGERYRKMLKFGGGVHPRRLMGEMLGFEPTIDELVDALYSDILQQRQASAECSQQN